MPGIGLGTSTEELARQSGPKLQDHVPDPMQLTIQMTDNMQETNE